LRGASRSDFNSDDWLSSEVIHDTAVRVVIVRLRAKQAVRIVEVQGFATDLEAFGLSMPAGFRRMQFGDGAKVPDAMKSEFEHMNRLNFRWRCSIPMKAGEAADISIPASGVGRDRIVLTLSYEYPRLFGLAKGTSGFYARLSPA
jgi:hypothetical protein